MDLLGLVFLRVDVCTYVESVLVGREWYTSVVYEVEGGAQSISGCSTSTMFRLSLLCGEYI